jgi:hypothetical protein
MMQNCTFAMPMNLQMLMHTSDTHVGAGTLKIGKKNWKSVLMQLQKWMPC